jgi:hypothetical protein
VVLLWCYSTVAVLSQFIVTVVVQKCNSGVKAKF